MAQKKANDGIVRGRARPRRNGAGALAERKQHDSKKTSARTAKRMAEMKPRARSPRPEIKEVGGVGARRINTTKSAKRVDLSPQNKTERTANARSKSYRKGIESGGQTGKNRKGLVTPSKGRRGNPPPVKD